MRERDILKICYLFYNEGMSQVDIGAKMEMSRWKIGRIIKDARERGLVTITLNHPQIDLGVALLRRPSLTVSGSLYCFIPDKLSYLITFR